MKAAKAFSSEPFRIDEFTRALLTEPAKLPKLSAIVVNIVASR